MQENQFPEEFDEFLEWMCIIELMCVACYVLFVGLLE